MIDDPLVAIYSQHTTNVNRLAASQGNAVLPYLDNIYDGINAILARYTSRKTITPKLQASISAQIDELVRAELQAYVRELKSEQREFGGYEAEFAAQTLDDATTEDFNSTVPAPAQITATVIATPIKLGENSYTTYNSMMRNYWQKWTDEIDAVVANGFINGQTISEVQRQVLDEIKPSVSGTTKSTLDKARRSARSIAITGTNHYANQARVDFAKQNERALKGYKFLSVVDSRTSQVCRANDQKTFKLDDPNIGRYTPPLHPNCRSSLVYDVDDRLKIDRDGLTRSSRFRVDGHLDPKPISTQQNYYEALAKLNAKDQDAILGPTLGKAFRKLGNPSDFGKFTVDAMNNPLTITEIKKRDNALSRILNT